jgi:hypothetical protein
VGTVAVKDTDPHRERYRAMPAAERMGHLASDLLRVSRMLQARQDDETILRHLHDIAWMIEANPEHATEELADMQREVCHWLRMWPDEAAGALLAFRAERMSARILDLSGLLEPVAGEAAAPRQTA